MKKIYIAIAMFTHILCAHAQGVPNLMDQKENANIIIDDELNIEEEYVDAFGETIKIQPQIIQNNTKSVAPTQAGNSKLNSKKSLTDNFKTKSETDNQTADGDSSESKTWIGSGFNALKELAGKSSKDNPLATAMEQGKGIKKRSNASVFDISGVMLRMSLIQADAALTKRGYKKVSQKMDIPNFIKWRNEETCRNNGVVGYERLNNCVIQIARKNNHEYTSQIEYNKYDTKETTQIFLTSNFTGNKVYKILYNTEAANMAGNSPKAQYLRKIKVYDFWKKINQKYGYPDNKEDAIWGLGPNKAYLRAITGALVLEDPTLKELDYTRMSREDSRFLNTDIYTF